MIYEIRFEQRFYLSVDSKFWFPEGGVLFKELLHKNFLSTWTFQIALGQMEGSRNHFSNLFH